MKRFLWVVAAVVCAATPLIGCWSPPAVVSQEQAEAVAEAAKARGIKTIIQTVVQQDYTVLNVIGGLAAFIAFGACIARAFGLPIPSRAVGYAVLCAVVSWLLRLVLVKYLWLVALLAIIALVVGGMGFAYGHRKWLEKRLGLDLDHDGKIGE